MQCPKCKVKLMLNDKKNVSFFSVRCIKCGAEFFVKEGMIKQKKTPKNVKKINIVKFDKNLELNNSLKIAKETKRIIDRNKEVQRLNRIVSKRG